MLRYLVNRKSTCERRFSRSVCGMMSGTAKVRVPPARLRPSDGAISAVVALYVAIYESPGRFWNVALIIASAGSGMLPFIFACVFPASGVTTRQVFVPSIVVAVCGTDVVDAPGRLPATTEGESTLKQTSSTVRP